MAFAYEPSYVWPNPAFPFRVYYSSDNLRIFIIENIQHNWEWLSSYYNKFKDTDYFFVYCGWYHSEWFAKEAVKIFDVLGLNRENFFFMFNEESEKKNFEKEGFNGQVINQNAWLDENLVMKPIDNVQKIYDAIYVGRFSNFKRHYLAGKVRNLALVAGNNHGNAIIENIPNYSYLNQAPLAPEEVCMKINESHCGLILSEEEGACFASSEYLLCGIPVVSTKERGGRSVWYDSYNSIVCEPVESQVAEAVEFFVNNPRCPTRIRKAYISKARIFRQRFILKLAELFEKHGDYELDADQYFKDNFIHKLRRSQRPDFESIFC
ncbi:glycosyltransferase [Reinekea marinisedimentorum]|uniref:Glycosyl transferase family 1 n=1 Tax=Reinekea marinisedimentorum TaxID=230495 RepID=A0A4R3I733_9GAMM|nr:glycosyltransferase [Reinekea marinisedimentorum]TCS41946.1 hypothetical protein BCF53_10450 [Reinekea marinisedimentorum]